MNKLKNLRLVSWRGPVKHLNRNKKAEMIFNVLTDYIGKKPEGLKILDIGCGNGGICSYFSNKGNVLSGVDIEDVRAESTGFEFKLVDSALLPFKDNLFDIVISNHTIEHIPEQNKHLEEIKRVLKKDGIIYLATPNKSSPIMEGHIGNDIVLSWNQMKDIFLKHDLKFELQSTKMLKNPKRYNMEFRYAKYVPVIILGLFKRFYPSHVFILTK